MLQKRKGGGCQTRTSIWTSPPMTLVSSPVTTWPFKSQPASAVRLCKEPQEDMGGSYRLERLTCQPIPRSAPMETRAQQSTRLRHRPFCRMAWRTYAACEPRRPTTTASTSSSGSFAKTRNAPSAPNGSVKSWRGTASLTLRWAGHPGNRERSSDCRIGRTAALAPRWSPIHSTRATGRASSDNAGPLRLARLWR